MKVIVNRKQYNKVITENLGYSKSVEDWSNYVTDELLPLIIKQDVKEDVYTLKKLSLKVKNNNFYKDIPIDSIIVTVIINDVEGDSAKINMGYNPYYTQIIENYDNTYNVLDVEFDVVMDLPKNRKEIEIDTLHYYFSSFLSHEFMHVYEWLNRNLENPNPIKGCEDVYKNGNINGDAVDRIAYMLYVTQSYELNAFVQQAATMIFKLKPKNNDEFLIYLKKSPIYLFAKKIFDFNSNEYMNEINGLNNDRKSELYNIIMCYYNNESQLPKIKSIDKFLNDLERKFKIIGEIFNRKLLRLITVI